MHSLRRENLGRNYSGTITLEREWAWGGLPPPWKPRRNWTSGGPTSAAPCLPTPTPLPASSAVSA